MNFSLLSRYVLKNTTSKILSRNVCYSLLWDIYNEIYNESSSVRKQVSLLS